MANIITESELILREDGAVYHLGLLPGDTAETIILVGDPNRVPKVSAHFDEIRLKKEVREFVTHTGILNGKRLTVLSTGIGCDNIDIVMNELDALVNIDFETRLIKEKKTVLSIIRIGTSGALQSSVPIDGFLVSSHGLGIDGLLNYYDHQETGEEKEILNQIATHTEWSNDFPKLYLGKSDAMLFDLLQGENTYVGITISANGFYAPQGRQLRLKSKNTSLNEKFNSFEYKDYKITNLEMETSAILSLGKLLGHKCASVSAILANRNTKSFSKQPDQTIENLIMHTLQKLTT